MCWLVDERVGKHDKKAGGTSPCISPGAMIWWFYRPNFIVYITTVKNEDWLESLQAPESHRMSQSTVFWFHHVQCGDLNTEGGKKGGWGRGRQRGENKAKIWERLRGKRGKQRSWMSQVAKRWSVGSKALHSHAEFVAPNTSNGLEREHQTCVWDETLLSPKYDNRPWSKSCVNQTQTSAELREKCLMTRL